MCALCMQVLLAPDSARADAASAQHAYFQRALRCHCAALLLIQPLSAEVGAHLDIFRYIHQHHLNTDVCCIGHCTIYILYLGAGRQCSRE